MPAVVGVLLTTAKPATADFRLRVEDLSTGTGAVVTSGGFVMLSGAINSFNVNVTTGLLTIVRTPSAAILLASGRRATPSEIRP